MINIFKKQEKARKQAKSTPYLMIIEDLEGYLNLARKKGVLEEEEFEGLKYYRFSDDLRKYLRGTVVIGDKVVFGYHKIARILSLENGILSHIKEPFYVEEKADGYNVRVVSVDGKIVAFTRGGFICPFTTDRLPDLGDFETFFRNHPDMVIAGEVVGPGNPYNEFSPAGIEDIAFFAFDIFPLGSWRSLSAEERYAILEKYDIPQVQSFGKFFPEAKEIERLKDILKSLNEKGAEGIVIKPQYGRRKFKYVTPFINISDIKYSSHLIAELPAEFFTQRIIRMMLSMDELKVIREENELKEIAQRLGEAFIEGFSKALKDYKSKGKVTWTFSLRMRTRERIELLVNHLNRASKIVKVSLVSVDKEDSYWRVVLEKHFLKSTDFMASALRGSFYFD